MPIRPDLLQFYRGPAWRAVRQRILDRAKDCCEACKVPNKLGIARIDKYPGWWFTLDGEAHDHTGALRFIFRGSEFDSPDRLVVIRLTIAHLNRTPGDDREDNLKALCQWCHLNYDRSANQVQAKETRLNNKDAARPILQEAS